MTVTPRLSRLLDVLLTENEPVSIDALAQIIGKSRRTVFRELENIDDILSLYNLELETENGKGLKLVCSEEEKSKLLEMLRENRAQKDWSRKERHLRLFIELLLNSGTIQKLFYYADKLGVSEATTSADLDILECYLKNYAIPLIRRPGKGVYTIGDEKKSAWRSRCGCIRTAISGTIILSKASNFFPSKQPALCLKQSPNSRQKSTG
jgi:mannitol operon transcriptional antiterminator